jgi:hypothetical protein
MAKDKAMITLRHICSELVRFDGENFYHRFDTDGEAPLLGCPACPYPLEDGWFRATYLAQPMNEGMMRKTLGAACSNCWGHNFIVQSLPPGAHTLVVEEDGEEIETANTETLYRVLCDYCLEETRGYVSNYYIGRARLRDASDYGLAITTLGVALGLVERRGREELLAELGFGM